MTRLAFVALVGALTGCNQVWGLRETASADGGPTILDAPTDASPMCESPELAPRFSHEIHQVVIAGPECSHYMTSASGIAIAECRPPSSQPDVRESIIDQPEMARAPGLNELAPHYSVSLTPEGAEAYVARYDPAVGAGVWRFERDANGIWSIKEKTEIQLVPAQLLSTVTRGPSRRLIVLTSNSTLVEYAQDPAGAWAQTATYSTSNDFGVPYVFNANLTADGLRLFMLASTGSRQIIVYTHRASIDDRFGKTVEIPDLPATDDTFLTEDCSRAYFSGLGSVFVVRRI